MRQMFRAAVTLASAVLLAACYTHNFPLPNQTFIHVPADPPTARVHVDPNGTFFPQLWLPARGIFGHWSAHSLLMEAERNASFGPLLHEEQRRQQAELRAFVAGKRRLFVFIHGFDNNQRDTEQPFDMMRRRLALGPGDAIIRFHWDGYDARIFGAQVSFWWMAVANSQMAGAHGLREILRATDASQQIFLISHSRGASVILSALSNPRFTDEFRVRTRALPFAREASFLAPPPLADGPRNVHAIMMAPAIGRVDFLVPDCQAAGERVAGADCDVVRRFPRLASLDYTLNACDEVLEKIVGLSDRFNPTDLGLVPAIGRALEPELGRQGIVMRPHRIIAPHDHDFPLYTADPEFSAMMAAVGVASGPWPNPPRPERCARARRETVGGPS